MMIRSIVKETRDIKDQSRDDAIMVTYFYDLLQPLALQVCSLLLEKGADQKALVEGDKRAALNA